MNNLEIAKFMCSHVNEYQHLKHNYFEAQRQYFVSEDNSITFDPLQFLASNPYLFEHSLKTYHKKKNSLVPKIVEYEKKFILSNGIITDFNKLNLCKIYLNNPEDFKLNTFPFEAYWSQYHSLISHHFGHLGIELDNIKTKTILFYVTYGFWNNIKPKTLSGFEFLASYPSLTILNSNAEQALTHYFKEGCSNVISFDPIIYVASNFEKLLDLVSCGGIVNKESACKHYINIGHQEKYEVDSFDDTTYLANNFNRINEILTKKKIIYWDYTKLNKTEVASNFIKHKGKYKTDKFDPVDFCKKHIDDTEPNGVNFDKCLSLKNASKYFVINYVKSSKVREEHGLLFMTTSFLRGRIRDSAKMIPLNVIKFIVQSKVV
jgi:hypothetical protein